MIPLAEKNGKKWVIPSEAEKPPCTGIAAALILENILEVSDEKTVLIIPPALEPSGKEILSYLFRWGFITEFSSNGNTYVLERGVKLIARINKKPFEEILANPAPITG